ncbi:hypothetical protein, partial [Nesterenkonia ebinurensis]|uniref:hypothetical protein n=1 Tax=Nesterenkonia ebinurensis TaxID=2608252 RepID=UPI001CC69DC3
SIEVTGPQNAVETATASYQVQAFDTYGNLIGNVTTETVVVSDVEADRVREAEVTFAFTPDVLTDRELVFTYTDEEGEEITTEVEVSVDSVVDEITVSVDPDRAGVGTTVEVTVEAFDPEGDSLGDVTEHATVSFEGEDLSGGEFTIPSAGTHELIAAYRDQEDMVSVMGEFPVLVDLEVTGVEQVTETQMVAYAVTGTDQFGETITVDFDALSVSSTVEADTITVDEGSSEVLVEFVFTPDGPGDRTVVFTYEVDGEVIDEVQIEVEVVSAVADLDVEVSSEITDGDTVPVTVTALNEGGEPLGEVTDYAGITSSVDSDEITEGELTVVGIGEREVTAEYRGQSASAEV